MIFSGGLDGILGSRQSWFKHETILERKFSGFSSSMRPWKIRWEASGFSSCFSSRSVLMLVFGFFKGSDTFECRSVEKPFSNLGFYNLMLAVNACLALGSNDNALGTCCQASHFDHLSIQVYNFFAKPLKLQKRCVCLSVGCRFIRCDIFFRSLLCFGS
ncbi:hypothetical protein V6N13_090386 [Hibiscus sabdariffa]